MAGTLLERLQALRVTRRWASLSFPGAAEVWRRTVDEWDLPDLPEQLALPPIHPWNDELHQLAQSEHEARYARFLQAGQHFELDWPPEGSLVSAGSWHDETPSCPEHGTAIDEGCTGCAATLDETWTVIDRPASWEWSTRVRTVDATGNEKDHGYQEGQVWILGHTDVDPRDVEYGPPFGSGEREALIRELWKVDLMPLSPTDWHRRSDIDGARHLIVTNPAIDCTGWKLEIRGADRTHVVTFERLTVFGTGNDTNLIGHGAPRPAWVAYMEWGDEDADILLPDGSRRPLAVGVDDVSPQLADRADRLPGVDPAVGDSARIARMAADLPDDWEVWHERQWDGPRREDFVWQIWIGSDGGYALRDHEFVWCDRGDALGLVRALATGVEKWQQMYDGMPDQLNLQRLLAAGPIQAGRLSDEPTIRKGHRYGDAPVEEMLGVIAGEIGASSSELCTAVFSLRNVGATSPWLVDALMPALDRAIMNKQMQDEWERERPKREAANAAREAAAASAAAEAERLARAEEERAHRQAVLTREQLAAATLCRARNDYAAEWGQGILEAVEHVASDRLTAPFIGYVETLQTAAEYAVRSFSPFAGWMEGAPPVAVRAVVEAHQPRLDDIARTNDAVCTSMLGELAEVLLGLFDPPLSWLELEAQGATRQPPPVPDDWYEW